MRRTGMIISVLVMLVAMALPALAVGPEWPSLTPHAHKITTPSGECVVLAGGHIVPKHAHHDNLHASSGAAAQARAAAGFTIVAVAEGTRC